MDPIMSDQKTPLDFFYQWEKRVPNHPFLRQPIDGTWITYTYKEAGTEIRKVATWLTSLAMPPQSNVAILSKNCAHWLMTDLAIMMAGHVSVPIYPILTAPAIRHLLEHSESKVIFVGKLDQYEQQKPGIPEGLIQASFPHYGVPVENPWSEILKQSEATPGEARPAPDSLATIMYSSGTTGFPKGVMLTHGAFGFVGERVWKYLKMDAHQRYFSYLPLSHIAERGLLEMSALASGSTISFAESLDTFAANLQQEEPTIFGGVPRIWAKFQEGVLTKLPQKNWMCC
ncbi:MAG: AMP-binding protein [Bacteroidia bacterium]|nr:AMP-binding protein [Bacteroidia bacterium]